MAKKKLHIAVFGGAGFIGSNAAARYLSEGNRVAVFDNLSRPGVARNIDWLKTLGDLDFTKEDIRSAEAVEKFFQDRVSFDLVIHVAGQTAVTRSLLEPREDFEANALGTINLLEALRARDKPTPLIYASTNKVYGELGNISLKEDATRWEFTDLPAGVPESMPLDFHSPYGCSRGAGDQYTRDYARIYDMPNVVFRQSCIYGPRQFGVVDQGWVAWFAIASLLEKPITLFGDGKVVRDLLYVDDLVKAFEMARRRINNVQGEVFNIGGGPRKRASLVEIIELLERLQGKKIKVCHDKPRPGDQKAYYTDIGKARALLDWEPKITVNEGVGLLLEWLKENIDDLRAMDEG